MNHVITQKDKELFMTVGFGKPAFTGEAFIEAVQSRFDEDHFKRWYHLARKDVGTLVVFYVWPKDSLMALIESLDLVGVEHPTEEQLSVK